MSIHQDAKINLTTTEYEKTESGKSWKSKPVLVEKEVITRDQYNNLTGDDTLRFFRRLGGSQVVACCYTKHGFIIVQLSSCNPDRTRKIVREFSFD